MSLANLENLVTTGQLKSEVYNEQEYLGLVRSGQTRLEDSLKEELTDESRFLLAYSAAHSFALAALRKKGYRSTNRYIVFQALAHTLGMKQDLIRVLDLCHNRRNVAEYEGPLDINQKLLQELLVAAKKLQDSL